MLKRFVTPMLVLVAVFLFSACGEIVEQNKIVLAFKMLGTRTAEISNVPETAQTELFTAKRLKAIKAGIKYIIFPLGNQTYRFTKLASIESPKNEEFTVNALDGNVSFDVVVQLHINTGYSDLKDRLVKFCIDYSLMKYAENPNALGMFVSERMKPQLKEAFQTYMADKKVLDLTRSKSEINKFVNDYMNKKYNQYGLEFTLAVIGSAFTFEDEQQKRMNDIVNQEVESRMIKIDTEKILPLNQEIARLDLEGEREVARILNKAKVEASKIRAEALEKRGQMIIAEIGKENYARYEQAMSRISALKESNATVKILPSDVAVFLGR